MIARGDSKLDCKSKVTPRVQTNGEDLLNTCVRLWTQPDWDLAHVPRAERTSAKRNSKCAYPNWSRPAFRLTGPKTRLDPKPDLPQRFGQRCRNDPACAGRFYAVAFDSPRGDSRVTGSRQTHSFTRTHPVMVTQAFIPLPQKYQHSAGWSAAKSSLYLLNLCSGPNPLGCGFGWHRAILLLTTGLLAASKTGRAGSRLFITSCLWNIDFVASGLLTGVWEIFISRRTAAGGIL